MIHARKVNPYGWEYQKARARLLKDRPMCHWCLLEGRQRPATTADHEPSIEEVGHPHLSLVPACGPCNYGRSNRKRRVNETPRGTPSREW